MTLFNGSENLHPITAEPRLAYEVFDLEGQLDKALESTFPASDPVSSFRVQNA